MKKTQKKYRLGDIISTAGLLLIIYGFGIALIATPDKEYSSDENRYLQTFPKFSAESLSDGTYTAEIADYCADQILFRNFFVGAKAISETMLGKAENNSVLRGSDGFIIAKEEYPNYSSAKRNLESVEKFQKAAGIPVHTAIAGRSQDVLFEFAPGLYPAKEVSDEAFERVLDFCGDGTYIDLTAPLRFRASEGEYVYYRTDHHWTTLGAYYAYCEIMSAYGMEPHPIEYFTREKVSDSFFGTTWSKAGMKWIGPDDMEFFRYEDDDTLVCEITDTGNVLDGMYDRSYLEKKDKYSAFISGNNARVRVYPAESSPFPKDRPTLLLIKDSFGHSVAPFLAAHFNLEIIDLRYYKPMVGSNPSISELAKEVAADRVLILYNMDSILNSSNLISLTLGLE